MAYNPKNQHGAAAIFIVVFFAILITVIALSFLRIAIQDQQQSTNNDLAQSAYDSADAGLEDAKRALSWYRVNCPVNNAPLDATNCATYNTTFDANKRCNFADLLETDTVPNAKRVGTTSEVKVSTTANDDALDQAYTCVTLTTKTSDYKGTAQNGKNNTLIPLRTVGNAPISTIELNWFINKDQIPLTPNYPSYPDLPKPANWTSTVPPIMRVQLIPVLRGSGNGFDIRDVDNDTKTAFIYPTKTGSGSVNFNTADTGRFQAKAFSPHRAKCDPTVNQGKYACSAQITPVAATGGSAANTDYYLLVTAVYNNADYQVRLLNGADVVQFDNVEPQVDSTGRANNVFRRVQSRVADVSNLPDFGATDGVCKAFNVPEYSTSCPTELINP